MMEPDDVTADRAHVKRTVAESLSKDAGRAVVRLDPADMKRLGVDIGDIVAVEGSRLAVAKVVPMHADRRGTDVVQLDGVLRHNAGASLGDAVRIFTAEVRPAAKVTLRPEGGMPSDQDLDYLGRLSDGLPVQPGDRLRVTLFGSDWIDFVVESTQPSEPVLIHAQTRLTVQPAREEEEAAGEPTRRRKRLTYEDVGGLDGPLRRVREMIELPLQHPGVFERLGIAAPSGVLLTGPPGCGKTLLARTIAAENDASFFSIGGPEVIRKFYGESEAELRRVFEQAEKQSPSILFIDEIDALAPNRSQVEGEVEKRVVATLLSLMDGLSPRRGVVVIAATNRPNAIDPALRRAGRFDREIAVPIPNRIGRRDILAVHTRGMPLDDSTDLDRLADVTHGFVGADLEALCREAAMAALRRHLPDFGAGQSRFPGDALARIRVMQADFQEAMRDVQPSATREVFTEIPSVTWDEVGGMTDAKKRLQEAVEWPLTHRDVYQAAGVAPPRGILLAGPPGCGKTLLARAVATESEINFISVKGPELLSKYVGESEQRLRDVFRKAREAAPCLIFFDEIDAVAPTRTSGRAGDSVASRVLAQLLTEMDGVEALDGVVVLGATNRMDVLDPALLRPGRFDEIVRVDKPGSESRKAIFGIHLARIPTTTVDIDRLVQMTDGFSGADVAAVCRRAAMDVVRRHISSGASAEDSPVEVPGVAIETAIQAFRGRVDDGGVARYEE